MIMYLLLAVLTIIVTFLHDFFYYLTNLKYLHLLYSVMAFLHLSISSKFRQLIYSSMGYLNGYYFVKLLFGEPI